MKGTVPFNRNAKMSVTVMRNVLRSLFFQGPGIHLVKSRVEDWAAHSRGTVPRLKHRAIVAPVRADPLRSDTPKMI